MTSFFTCWNNFFVLIKLNGQSYGKKWTDQGCCSIPCRYKGFLVTLLRTTATLTGKRVVVVSHEVAIMELCRHTDKPDSYITREIPNVSLNIFHISGLTGEWILKGFGDIDHLKKEGVPENSSGSEWEVLGVTSLTKKIIVLFVLFSFVSNFVDCKYQLWHTPE